MSPDTPKPEHRTIGECSAGPAQSMAQWINTTAELEYELDRLVHRCSPLQLNAIVGCLHIRAAQLATSPRTNRPPGWVY